MAIDTRPRDRTRAAQTDPLLAARTRIPRPRFPVLARPRVDGLLSAAVRNRVTLVHAIAGAGKTTACASWAASATAYDVAWFGVDPADNPVRLCAGVRAALDAIGAPWTAGLPPAPDETAAVADFAAGTAAAIAGARRPVVLVLDAVDGLDSGRLAPVEPLIDHAPAELRFVLTGRRRPALRLARYRVSGELAVLTSTDLACDRAELAGYLDLAYDGDTGIDAEELLARTDGWFAAVHLLAGYELPPDVADYVEDEVLGERDGDAAGLLARLAALDRVTPDLTARLTGDADAPERLAALTADGLLVADGARLRCRAPLADVLTRPPHAPAPADRIRLLREAADWYAAHGHPADALRTVLRGADADTTARVLTGAGLRTVATAGPSAVDALLDAAEPEGAPAAAALVRATARVFAGDAVTARRYLAAARRYLAAAGTDADPVFRVKVATLALLLGDEPGDAPGEPTTADGEYAYATGLRRLEDGALGAAAEAFRSAAELPRDFPELAAHARGWAALALAWRGDLRECELLIGSRPDGGRSWPMTLARAWLCLERDDSHGAQAALDEASGAADAGRPVRAFPGEPDFDTLTGMVRVRVAIAHGDLGLAHELLDRLPAGSPCAEELRTALGVELAHRRGDIALGLRLALRLAHRAWVADADDLPEAVPVPAAGVTTPAYRVLLARALLQADKPRAALHTVATLITNPPHPHDDRADDRAAADTDGTIEPTTGTAGTITADVDAGAGARVGALAVAAAACGRLRASEDAARLLTDALTLAATETAYAALLACGQPLRTLVTTHKPEDAEHDRVRRELLRRFDLRPVVHREPRATVLEEPLTRAELSVLRFLSSYMTNTEIAESLVVSVNTVKTHLRSIYRKLGVSTRRDAVRAADRLGLL